MHEYKELTDYFEQTWRIKQILDVVHKTDGSVSKIARRLPIERSAVNRHLIGVNLAFPDEVIDIIADTELSINDCQELLIIKEKWVVPAPLIREKRKRLSIPHINSRTRVLELQEKNPDMGPGEIAGLYNEWRKSKDLPSVSPAYVTNFIFQERSKQRAG